MKRMSFSMTKASFVDGSKTVTRRLGWGKLKPGEIVCAVEKSMGLKKGEKIVVLGYIRVVNVRREPLAAINSEASATTREGLPDLTAPEFVHRFCKAMNCPPESLVTRIEFVKIDKSEAFPARDTPCENGCPIDPTNDHRTPGGRWVCGTCGESE